MALPHTAHSTADASAIARHITRHFVLFAFILLLALLLLVSGVGLWRVHEATRTVETVVAERNLKTELATTMRGLHRERHQALQLAASRVDAFEQDEALQDFRALAGEFLLQRERFLETPLSAAERGLWERIRPEIAEVGRVSDQFIDLLRSDRQVEAKDLLNGPLRIRQERMLALWDEMVGLQRQANLSAVETARQGQRVATTTMSLLTLFAVLTGIVAASFVYLKLRRNEDQLHAEKDLARATLSGVGDAVIRIGRESRVEYLNPGAERLLDSRSNHVAGLHLTELVRLDTDERDGNAMADLLAAMPRHDVLALSVDTRLRRDTLPECDVEGALTALRDSDGHYAGAVLTLRDVTLMRDSQRQIAWQAAHDGLTGLANRRQFEQRLDGLLSSKRHDERYFSLLFVDLDNFKHVNDSAGHRAGDELLRHVANLMRGKVRDHDLVARLGGDEFALLLNDCPRDRARGIAERIVADVCGLDFIWQGGAYRIGASIGLLHAGTGDFVNMEACLHAADEACYQAKRGGRGRVVEVADGARIQLARAS
jgi:diguanylate cyclase (GGDEF)-like protein